MSRILSSKTPLFAHLRDFASCLREEAAFDGPSALERFEILKSKRISRRLFLKNAGVAAALVGTSSILPGCVSSNVSRAKKSLTPKIVIVGAGIAGLNASYQLQKVGVPTLIYEASARPGGRMYSAKNILGPGLVTELGGEFIDSNHEDIMQIATDFGLQMIDTKSPAEEKYRDGFFFKNKSYSEAQILDAFRPITTRIQADFDSLGDEINFKNDGGSKKFDHQSIAEYLDSIDARGIIRELLDVAYVTEYGLEAEEQSALNLLLMVGTDLKQGLKLFGDSDERYKVLGGNQAIADALANYLESQIRYEHTLVSIDSRNGGYRLTFENSNSSTVEVDCEVVVLTLPFSVLRNVTINIEMPDFKKNAIQNLGYGTNAKVLVGFNERYWRTLGLNGAFFSDEGFQLCWDNSRTQAGTVGGLTLYSGGKSGVQVGEGTTKAQAERLLPGVDKAMPGVAKFLNGKVERFHWPSFRYSLGSYSTFKPGQWTTIAGSEGLPIGNIFFAGEHCSYDFQGFMNGGAETGRRAAELIYQRMTSIQVIAKQPAQVLAVA